MTTYTVVHVVVGEKPSIMYQITREQLTSPAWVCKTLFNWDTCRDSYYTAKELISDPVYNNPNAKAYIFEGDAGFIFIFETDLTNLYETISL